jgi:hypothetical protein
MFVPSNASRLVLPVTGNVPTNVPSLTRSFETLLEIRNPDVRPIEGKTCRRIASGEGSEHSTITSAELNQSVQGNVCNPNVFPVESSAECVARQIEGRSIGS